MGGLFKGNSNPSPPATLPPPPLPPLAQSAQGLAAAQTTAQRAAAAYGPGSTVKTGPQGAPGVPDTTQKSLLGQ